MSKEKQIGEMTVIINKAEHDMWEGNCKFENHSETIAEYLYNAGYRKQSEVAREIFEEIERTCVDSFGCFYTGATHGAFAELKKKYAGD